MKILIVTNSFPFMPGEQFLETEISYWVSSPFSAVIVAPERSVLAPRMIPKEIRVDVSLTERQGRWRWIVKGMFSRYVLTEVWALIKFRRLRAKSLWITIRKILSMHRAYEGLKLILRRDPEIGVIYTYWNSTSAYAACLLKRQGAVNTVVSRIHRGDLYEESAPGGHIPLKREFVSDFDCVFALSPSARDYAIERFNFPPKSVHVHRLGVELPKELTPPTPPGEVHLLSVSYCVREKRIDRLISALRVVAQSMPTLRLTWTHIGGGPLFTDLQTLADETLSGQLNLVYRFLGELTNDDVRRFYLENSVDFFVNVSESEGTPVSIMEAMSAAVPVIAPGVGGMSDLLNASAGILLDMPFNQHYFEHALEKMIVLSQRRRVRTAAKKIVEEKFHAGVNYPDFISKVGALGNFYLSQDGTSLARKRGDVGLTS